MPASTSKQSNRAASCSPPAARKKLGVCDTLDIGGGFPIDYMKHVPEIGPFCAPIRAALAKLPKRVRIIAGAGPVYCWPVRHRCRVGDGTRAA